MLLRCLPHLFMSTYACLPVHVSVCVCVCVTMSHASIPV